MRYPDLSRYAVAAIDLETTGLQWWKDKIFGVALSTPDDQHRYWDVRDDPRVLDWLKEAVKSGCLFVNHHIKFDALFMRKAGIILPDDRMDCTMVRAALIDEHRLTYDLDSVALTCIGTGKQTAVYAKLAELFGGKPTADAQGPNMHRAPSQLIGPYAAQDTKTALALWQWQETEIENQNLRRVAELERQLLPVLVDIEYGGVHVDINQAEIAAKEIDVRAKIMQKELDDMAGFPVNPNPSGSIHKLFNPQKNAAGAWILCDGTIAESTEGGKASINADVLREMKHPAADRILRLRKMIKTRDTFLRGHVLSYHNNGVIHANYNQTKSENDRGTGTGRLSVNSPALQQIPARDVDIAAVVRAIFLPDDGQDWGCWDWAQMDFRMMAHYVNTPTLIKAYLDNPDTDFHQLASDLTGLPRKPRYAGDANAKQINLALVFGMGMGKLAWEMGLPYTLETYGKKTYMKPGPEAVAVFNKYHRSVPGVKEMLERASALAKEREYVLTIMGRRIRFPGGRANHKAGGLIFQGSAADALKQKLVEVHREVKGTEARILMNVHDEFDLSVPKGDAPIKRRVTEILTTFDGVSTPIKFRVPIRSEAAFASNWWESSK